MVSSNYENCFLLQPKKIRPRAGRRTGERVTADDQVVLTFTPYLSSCVASINKGAKRFGVEVATLGAPYILFFTKLNPLCNTGVFYLCVELN